MSWTKFFHEHGAQIAVSVFVFGKYWWPEYVRPWWRARRARIQAKRDFPRARLV